MEGKKENGNERKKEKKLAFVCTCMPFTRMV